MTVSNADRQQRYRNKRKSRVTGECPLCLSNGPLHIDHCHGNAKVRGFVCSSCNSMLGYAKDDVETLRRAIDYLARPPLQDFDLSYDGEYDGSD